MLTKQETEYSVHLCHGIYALYYINYSTKFIIRLFPPLKKKTSQFAYILAHKDNFCLSSFLVIFP